VVHVIGKLQVLRRLLTPLIPPALLRQLPCTFVRFDIAAFSILLKLLLNDLLLYPCTFASFRVDIIAISMIYCFILCPSQVVVMHLPGTMHASISALIVP
jgi:hypothetical protein